MHRMMVAPATWRRKHVGDVDNMERLQADYEALFVAHKVRCVCASACMLCVRVCVHMGGG